MKKPIVNIEQSIHQKLLNQAKSTKQTFEHVLKRYAMEQFLYRLSMSPHVNYFVLKGGLLLACYEVPTSRMKDFYDIWMLSSTFEYDSADLSIAIKQTFKHCKREIEASPSVLQETFAVDVGLTQKWRVFLQKNNLTDAPREFFTVELLHNLSNRLCERSEAIQISAEFWWINYDFSNYTLLLIMQSVCLKKLDLFR